ncbi:MAG: translation initiation factor IF-2 [Myxococcales bacterium]|nr:translation initiation factor IF-2 [Myxococcales bacterium]
MAKIRVHQVAKELGLSSKEFIEKAQQLGFTHITSHANTLENNEIKELKQKVGGGKNADAQARPTVLRRRAQTDTHQSATNIQTIVTRREGENEVVIQRLRWEMPQSIVSLPNQLLALDLGVSVPQTPTDLEVKAPVEPVVAEPVKTAETAPIAQTPAPPPPKEVPVVSSAPVQEESRPEPTPLQISEPQNNGNSATLETKERNSETSPVQAETNLVQSSNPSTTQPNNRETTTASSVANVSSAPASDEGRVKIPTPIQEPAGPAGEDVASSQHTTPKETPIEEPRTSHPGDARKTPSRAHQPEENKISPMAEPSSQTTSNVPPPRVEKTAPTRTNTNPPRQQTPPERKFSATPSFQRDDRPNSPNGPNGPKKPPRHGEPAFGEPAPTDGFGFGEDQRGSRKQSKRHNRDNRPATGTESNDFSRKKQNGKQQPAPAVGKLKKGKPGKPMKPLRGPQQPITAPMSEKKRVIKVDEAISVSELAHRMGVKATELIMKLLKQGVMATINQALSVEEATRMAKDFGYDVQDVGFEEETILQEEELSAPEEMLPRPPVVTVMGHVDHGKTSLLDSIRAARVVDQEAGGITQHIGAYAVERKGNKIVFLDTPGHEAFTAMRARGAKTTDIVILVVAADDGIMPQTVEAIRHAQSAEVPIVVAINKIDKASADPNRVRYELTQYNLLDESLGGGVQMIEVSALTGQGIDELLERVLLEAEILELRANPSKMARGTVLESRIEKGRGPVSTFLVQEGTLHSGDAVVVGPYYGRVRAMFDDKNEPIKEAGPSMPVRVLGLSGLPDPGEGFNCVVDEKAAKQVAEHRQEQTRRQEQAGPNRRASFGDFFGEEKKELNIILKADMQGSLEALRESLLKIQHNEIELAIPLASVGGITENDVNLAATTNSVIIGFQVRPDAKAQKLAETEGVEIRIYRVIYDLLNDVKAAMEKQLSPTIQEKPMGQAEIRSVFAISKVGKIAGCYITEGKITRNALIRLYRNDIQIYEGKIGGLKRFKNDAREVAQGYECGVQVDGYQDIREGDIIEAYELEEIETKLES